MTGDVPKRAPRVAWPLVCGVSKNEQMKKANGTADRQYTNSKPRMVPKLAPLKRPPTVNSVHRKDITNPRITPSEMK